MTCGRNTENLGGHREEYNDELDASSQPICRIQGKDFLAFFEVGRPRESHPSIVIFVSGEGDSRVSFSSTFTDADNEKKGSGRQATAGFGPVLIWAHLYVIARIADGHLGLYIFSDDHCVVFFVCAELLHKFLTVGKVTLIFYSCGQISLDGFFNNGFSRREVILAIRSVADSEKKKSKKRISFSSSVL